MNTQYYNKYIKYKQKYIRLKQLVGGDITIEHIDCGFGGCAFKITIDDNIFVLKSYEIINKPIDDQRRYNLFSNELLKGIDIATICKGDNTEMEKYFCIPIYFPIFGTISLKEINKFYKQIYNERFNYYQSMIKDESKEIYIMNDITITQDNITDNIQDKINYYINILSKNIKKIGRKITTYITGREVTKYKYWYITEYGGTDLSKYFSNLFSSEDMEPTYKMIKYINTHYMILQQIHKVMNFLHNNNIYHMDLKYDNICYYVNNSELSPITYIKLIDFGSSKNKNELNAINMIDNRFQNLRHILIPRITPPEIRMLLYNNNIDMKYVVNTDIFQLFYMTLFDIYYINTETKKKTYNIDNINDYFEKYGLKWCDYFSIGIDCISSFIYYIKYINRNTIVLKPTDYNNLHALFNQIYSILLSWCMVDYNSRSDKFNLNNVKQFELDYKQKYEHNTSIDNDISKILDIYKKCNPCKNKCFNITEEDEEDEKYNNNIVACDMYYYMMQLYNQLDPIKN